MKLDLKLSQMREALADRPEFRFTDTPDGMTIVCYMVANDDTFDHPVSIEARGIVFDTKTENVLGRPLHKFFNLGERSETRLENIDWSQITRVMEKRDGSLIHTIRLPTEEFSWAVKSKKSLTSDVAWRSMNFLQEYPEKCKWLRDQVLADRTVIMEWTAPDNRIVIGYPEEDLTILHIRENVSGRYLSLSKIKTLNPPFPIVAEDENAKTAILEGRIIEYAQQTENVEGWVIQLDDFNMIKVKTDWYLKRHRLMTFVRERDIALMVLEESLDDLKALWAKDGIDLTRVQEIEQAIGAELRCIIEQVKTLVSTHQELSRKDFAIKFNEHQYFGLMMKEFSNKEPPYKEWYKKYRLDTWSLTTVRTLGSINNLPSQPGLGLD